MGGLQPTGRLVHWLRRIVRRSFVAQWSVEGFTLVEVMIVLVVTGALFASAAYLIIGKQNQTGFNQAIQQIQSQIQQTMNEASIGYFPNNANFQCTAGATGPVIGTVSASGQGSNSDCIFVGKALQFKVHSTAPEQVLQYSLAGLRIRSSDGQDVQSLGDALPKVVDQLTTDIVLQNSLTTSRMWYNNGGPDVSVGAVAFTTTFPSAGSGGSLTSGSQQLNVIPIDTSGLDATQANGESAITGHIADSSVVGPGSSPINPSNGVSICFASGGTNQSGLVKIGGSNHPLSITVSIIDGNTTCS